MALDSTEDARRYLKNVDGQLKKLTQLSEEAGLNTHLALLKKLKRLPKL